MDLHERIPGPTAVFLFLKLGQCLSVKTRYVFGPVNELRCKVKVDDNSLDLEVLALKPQPKRVLYNRLSSLCKTMKMKNL